MAGFHVTIVAPTGMLYDGDADMLVAPGESGSFGVLANHAPMISGLQEGVLRIDEGGTTHYFAVGPGLVEVSKAGVSVLADRAEAAGSEDEARAKLTRATDGGQR